MEAIGREHGWAIFDPRKKQWVGIDQNSGGYPWWPESSKDIAIFQSYLGAQTYRNVFRGTGSPERSIHLSCHKATKGDANIALTTRRWESFGWNVVESYVVKW